MTCGGLNQVQRGQRLCRREGIRLAKCERVVQEVEPERKARLGGSVAEPGDAAEQRHARGVGGAAPHLGQLHGREQHRRSKRFEQRHGSATDFRPRVAGEQAIPGWGEEYGPYREGEWAIPSGGMLDVRCKVGRDGECRLSLMLLAGSPRWVALPNST
eukprot:scaffold15939_cov86-Isochrysis_galbana.AAC.3